MAEYIEKDKLISDCKKRISNDWNNMVAPLSWAQAEKKFLKILEEAQTEDVAPVRHGRWKYYKKQGIAVCTACSFERKLDDDFGRAISCPNCGANMDLEG